MTTRHLANALPFALKRAEAALEEVGAACDLAGRIQGEAASRDVDQAIEALARAHRDSLGVLEAMTAELERRRAP